MEYSTSSDKHQAEKNWEEIGIQLEMDTTSLRNVRARNTDKDDYPCHKSDLAFREMLVEWLKQNKHPPTWLSFVEALDRLKICQNLASHLRSKFCKSLSSLIGRCVH